MTIKVSSDSPDTDRCPRCGAIWGTPGMPNYFVVPEVANGTVFYAVVGVYGPGVTKRLEGMMSLEQATKAREQWVRSHDR